MNVFDLFAKISLDTSEYTHGLSDAGGIAENFGAKVGTILVDVSKKFLDVGKACVTTGMEFDKSMSQVAATLGQDIESPMMQTLRDFAQEMGSKTAFTAAECSEALNYMALAGYDAQTSMEMLPIVLDLAAAGNMGLAKASDMVTDSQTALGLSIDETKIMVDQMAKAAASSNTSVEQLGDAILTVGANAKGMKGGTQELITLLGKLADNGIKGSEGGTKLRNMLSALRGNTEDASAMMESFGISLYDSSGNIRMINDVLDEFSAKMSKMTREEQDNVISTMFNARDMAAARSLIDSAATAYDDLTAKIADSNGAAAEMAGRQLDNLAGDVTLFGSALDNLKISISDLLTPMLRQGVDFGQTIIGELQNFVGAFKANGFEGLATMFRLEMEDVRRSILEPFIGDSPDLGTAAIEFAGKFLTKMTDTKTWAAVNDKFSGFAGQIINGLTSETAMDAFFDTEHGAPKVISNLITNASRLANSFIDLAGDLLTNLFTYCAKEENREIIKNGAQDIMIALGEGFVGTVSNIHKNIVDLMSDIAVEMVGDFDADATALEMILKLGQAFAKKVWESTLPGRIMSWYDDWGEQIDAEAANTDPLAAGYTAEQLQKNTDNARDLLAVRRQYSLDPAAMSDAELRQWWQSGSSMDPLSWYNSLSSAEKMALYAERNPDVKGLPHFGDGGIVTTPTLAIVGEKGPEKITPIGQESAAVVIQFGDIYVSGTQNAGQEVVRQIDEALRSYQLQQVRGIGGMAWQQ